VLRDSSQPPSCAGCAAPLDAVLEDGIREGRAGGDEAQEGPRGLGGSARALALRRGSVDLQDSPQPPSGDISTERNQVAARWTPALAHVDRPRPYEADEGPCPGAP